MSDKLRAALFDVAGPVGGLTVLDAYAGSGAVGFEGLSRGAGLVVAIEGNAAVAKTIQKSAADLAVDSRYTLISRRIESWLQSSRLADASKFDLIVADPPYDQINVVVLDRLGRRLTAGGLMVVSHSSRTPAPALQSVQLVRPRKYGDSSLSFYRADPEQLEKS